MRSLRMLGASVVLAVVACLAVGAPAQAHDQLIASSPAEGEQLSAAPSEVRLQFTADILTIGAVVLVVDASGQDWSAGEAQLDGTAVTLPLLPDMPVAGYQVRWRVVSSDGHPISGVIPFAVGDAEPLEPSGAAAGGSTSEGDGSATSQSQTQAGSEESAGILRFVLIGTGGAALALVVLILITLIRRRGTAPDEQNESERTNQ